MLVVNAHIKIPDDELHFTFARSSGPGGQNVNKVNSKAILRWSVTKSPNLPDEVRARFLLHYANRITAEGEIVLASQTYRDQPRNVLACRQRLQTMLKAVAARPRRRKKTKPSRGSIERRLQQKRETSRKKNERRGGTSRDD